MDRTAWIAITLCVLGLVAWQIWIARQPLPPPAVATAPSPASPSANGTPASAPTAVVTPAPQAGTGGTSGPAAARPQCLEENGTLRNSHRGLHLRKLGGRISERPLLARH